MRAEHERDVASLLGTVWPDSPDRTAQLEALAQARRWRGRSRVLRLLWTRRALQLRRESWVWVSREAGWQPRSAVKRAILNSQRWRAGGEP